jgi:hypothetical protein
MNLELKRHDEERKKTGDLVAPGGQSYLPVLKLAWVTEKTQQNESEEGDVYDNYELQILVEIVGLSRLRRFYLKFRSSSGICCRGAKC